MHEAPERRRTVYTATAVFAGVLLVGLHLLRGSPSGWDLPVGAAVCFGAALALRQPRVSVRAVEHAVLVAVSLSVAAQLAQLALRGAGPPASMMFLGIFLYVAGLSTLPPRAARWYCGAVWLAFAAATLLPAAPSGDGVLALAYLGLSGAIIAQLSGHGREVSLEREAARLYERMALTDPLTGVPNRRAMWERLARAPGGVGVMLIDVDHFKAVNDTFGHEAGDRVLRAVAASLQAQLPPDAVARWGGEEFLVALPLSGWTEAEHTALALLRSVRGLRLPVGPVTVSIGIALPDEAETLDGLIGLADRRMYHAKERGRDRAHGAGPKAEGPAGEASPPPRLWEPAPCLGGADLGTVSGAAPSPDALP